MSQKRRDNKNRILQTGESQRSDGRYAYKYIDNRGKTKFVYAWKLVQTDKTPAGKREDLSLREKERQIKKDLDDRINTDAGKMTVIDLFKKHSMQNSNVRKGTVINRNNLIKLLENDNFGSMNIEKVKMSDAKEWIIRMRNKGYAYSSLSNHKRSLNAVFYMAVENDYIRKNPFHFEIEDLIENDTIPTKPLSKDQEHLFLEFIRQDEYYCNCYDDVLVFLGTGLRSAELCGLTKRDLDFESRMIDVNHQLLGNHKKGFYVTPPKTKSSIRKIPMSETVYWALKRIVSRPRPEQYEVDGYTDFVFINGNGIPRNGKYYRNTLSSIKTKCSKVNEIELPKISPHVLRHTFCTNMANLGMNPKALQYIMGHKKISMTLDYYAHATFASAKAEMDRVLAC